MRTFADKTGRMWSIDLTVGACTRVRANTEINLFAPDKDDLLGKLNSDFGLFWEVLWSLVEPQAVQLQVKHQAGVMTMTRAKNLARATASVNTDTWSTFAPGEALFMGLDTDLGTVVEVDSTYEFIASENRNDISIGDIADDIAKKGHELLWVTFEDAVDDGKAAKKPLAVYVERVYKQRNFAQTFGFEAS